MESSLKISRLQDHIKSFRGTGDIWTIRESGIHRGKHIGLKQGLADQNFNGQLIGQCDLNNSLIAHKWAETLTQCPNYAEGILKPQLYFYG